MQDMDSELVSNQRKRRKRIGRIRNGIIFGVIGWFVLSMVLIICLFVKVNSMQKQIETLRQQRNRQGNCRRSLYRTVRPQRRR